jgi:GH24 family phage-related lysozyme (muramidase)
MKHYLEYFDIIADQWESYNVAVWVHDDDGGSVDQDDSNDDPDDIPDDPDAPDEPDVVDPDAFLGFRDNTTTEALDDLKNEKVEPIVEDLDENTATNPEMELSSAECDAKYGLHLYHDGRYINNMIVGNLSTDSIDEPTEDQTNSTCYSCPSHIDSLAWAEGVRKCTYLDQIGVPTVGVGFNLFRWDIQNRTEIMGFDLDKLINDDEYCLTDCQIKAQFVYDMWWSSAEAQRIFKTFFRHPQCVQQMLADWVFNRGGPDIINRTELVNAIDSFNYQAAASYLRSTDWCNLIARRCDRHLNILESCNN